MNLFVSSSSLCASWSSPRFLVIFSLVFGAFWHGACADECLASLQSVADFEYSIGGPEQAETPRKYVLCPNTTYTTVIVDQGGNIISEGGSLAPFLRSNAVLQCGPNGNPEDNCVIADGSVGMEMFYDPEYDLAFGPYIRNSSVIGVTFRNFRKTTISITDYEGDFLFKDCIFEGSALRGNIFLSGRRVFSDDRYTCNITATTDSFRVTFDGCIFRDNKGLLDMGDTIEGIEAGLIATPCPSQTLIFRDNIFVNNDFTRDSRPTFTAMINMEQGGGLIMQNNCFIDNAVLGEGPVIFTARLPNEYPDIADTFVTNSSAPDAKCTFASIYSPGDTDEPACIDAELDFCPLLPTPSPTIMPTASPTASPTSSPTASPEAPTFSPTADTSAATTAARGGGGGAFFRRLMSVAMLAGLSPFVALF